ncbi:MAG: domain S-box protein [Pedobacter sp.]|jgi:PAS domain S-box-containing protein|nr:domain S-box protein [Pedobacter sp.]
MPISTDPFFKAFFNSPIPRVILESDIPDFSIYSYNQAYSKVSHTEGRDLAGLSLWKAFDPKIAGGNGAEKLLDLLKHAIETKTLVNTTPFRYDIPGPEQQESEFNWWQLEIIPVVDECNSVTHLMLTTNNVNEKVFAEQALSRSDKSLQLLNEEQAATNEELSALNEELSASNEELRQSQESLEQINGDLEGVVENRMRALRESETTLRNLVMTVHHPLVLLKGRDWVVEIANQQLVELWNKTLPEVLGKRLMDILPEIQDQPFPKLLKQVYDTGISYGQEEELLVVNTPEGRVEKYISFYYDPMYDSEGAVSGIIVAAEDITSKVEARYALEQSFRKEQELNEEITAMNEELTASNEELIVTNEELIDIEKSLQETVKRLADSEARIRYMVADAPVAIGLLSGEDLVVESANAKILEVWGKDRSIIGMPLCLALPEIKGQPFMDILGNVFETGEPYYGNEVKANLEYSGVMKEVYFNFVYHPLKHNTGRTVSIMLVATDVTEQVQARQVVEASATRFRFILNAIPQQVWTAEPNGALDYVNQVVCNDFGKSEAHIVGYGWQEFIHPEDISECLQKWQNALETGREYVAEFRLLFEEGSYVWHLARAVPLIEQGEIKLWLGTNTNIDMHKSNSQKKDEFLSIASHELKTPLTSIKAYNQLISRSKDIDKLQGFVGKSAEHIVRLERLIADLLDVTKINAGKLNYNMQPFSFKQMLQESIESVQHTSLTHRIVLQSAADVMYVGDNFRLEQVMNNFLTNAVKYSPDAEEVVVNCKVEGGNIIVSVQDFGIGIAEDSLDKLFDRYYRVDNTAMRFEGLGLGLFISSEILKRHQGSFWIESEQGKGSTFFFRLPIEQKVLKKRVVKNATFYQDNSISVTYNKSKNRLDVDWEGFQDLNSVKHGGIIMLEMLRNCKADKLLNDNTRVLGTWSEASDWAGKEWLPMMEEAGLKYFAWIFSTSVFSQLSAKKSIDVMHGNVVTQFFTSIELAEEWLDSV